MTGSGFLLLFAFPRLSLRRWRRSCPGPSPGPGPGPSPGPSPGPGPGPGPCPGPAPLLPCEVLR